MQMREKKLEACSVCQRTHSFMQLIIKENLNTHMKAFVLKDWKRRRVREERTSDSSKKLGKKTVYVFEVYKH